MSFPLSFRRRPSSSRHESAAPPRRASRRRRALRPAALEYLEGRTVPADLSELDMYSGARVTVNAQVARRLGVDVDALQKMGARIE